VRPILQLLTTCLMTLMIICPVAWGQGGLHTAPIVVHGFKIKPVLNHPLGSYRLYRSAPDGSAVPIPFQIDEVNEWGDYVLDQGSDVTRRTGNGLFDLQDELTFMGDDVGPLKRPTKWTAQPDLVFEIALRHRGPGVLPKSEGAVYLAVYFAKPPPPSDRRYVVFSRPDAEVRTSRYKYGFDQKNWLVARHVELRPRGVADDAPGVPALDSTTFWLRADLKYFLTMEVNHRSINSALEAWKSGPVRSIVRVSFHYTMLRLNFELGMYTEISFFSNAVFLPAIMYNPIDGGKSLNRGSGFYYGMALKDNPAEYTIETNMPAWKESGLLDFFKTQPRVEPLYWVSAAGKDRLLYMEIAPSRQMRDKGAVPLMYREDLAGPSLVSRGGDKPASLGKGPVNLALYFDLTRFSEGEHIMAFRLFFENVNDPARLATFRTLTEWNYEAVRL
jgi:hypothetical protein